MFETVSDVALIDRISAGARAESVAIAGRLAFCAGWSDRQFPDGTVEFTAPTGHTYVTEPHGAGLFPTLAQPTGELNLPEPPAHHPNRGARMPTRRQTREQDRRDRINAERRLRAELNNDLEFERDYQAWLAEEYGPPPPF
ncbi:hypothetical protein [Mycobacterium sp. DL99]|uniref:hypothetical protein n=1 Tax=Mycobacterium sp. DL99 TaxID=2528957 RepID=UPI00336C018C